MSDNTRPDPDRLLASLHREEARARRGHLKVFFGMCPGVGKTYAMLRAARGELDSGVDLVVGVVETHKRSETEALLAGLPVVAKKRSDYRGMVLEELDLESILARRPALVLVDELAHTNAPGSRHPKRYQDVIELLEAGIDVFSTLNVQHLESRADTVRQITGVQVQETVPDSVFELADQIELIDLPPEALLERLKEGKVYLGERAQTAADNFFQETHLTALRELALRFVAEHVDRRLREMRGANPVKTVWRSGERLLVGVGPSPSSTQLVRWTRRMAAAQGAAWLAVCVETSRQLSPEDQRRLDRNIALARELGAEVVLTHDNDVAAALVRVALQNHVTQIVVGKSRSPRWLDLLRGGSLVDRLLRKSPAMDVYVVPPERSAERDERWVGFSPTLDAGWREYGLVAASLAGMTLLGQIVVGWIGYMSVGFLLLLAVLGLCLKVGRGPLLTAGALSALLWDFLFIPPLYTFYIGKLQDGMMFVSYIVVALVAGQLTSTIRAQQRHERSREERATALFHLTRALSAARNLDDGVTSALRQTDQLFGAASALLLAADDGHLKAHGAGTYPVGEKELSVADWAWRNRKRAGRFTDTLPSSEALHLPLVRENRSLGVLVLRLPKKAALSTAQLDLAEGFASQIALLAEREKLRSAAEREKLLLESEKLHRTLLDGVSHELKTPLAVLNTATESLPESETAAPRQVMTEIRTAVRRLNRLVNNLLDQTRLETGALKPRLDWCDANDLINAAIESLGDVLAGHPFEQHVADDMPLFLADGALMEQVIANLLVNAALHTPSGTPVFLAAGAEKQRGRVFFSVADRGPGLPPDMKDRLFKKFQRGDAAHAGGLGLGLSIIRGFVSAQGGEVVAGANPGGGAVFTVYLPYKAHGAVPEE